MLFYETLTGKVDKVQKAIDRIKSFEPPEGYYLAFSGGKDSQCIYHLAKMAGVKFDAHYAVTTVDPTELMRFIKAEYPDVIWEHPVGKDGKPTSMWKLIAEHTIPPTRQARYCCQALKETGGVGRLVLTGVRWAESINRRDSHGVVDVRTSSKKFIDEATKSNPAASLNKHDSLIFMDDNDETRKLIETCYLKKRSTVNPIIDWEETDVWQFLNEVAKVPHCCLYDEGFTRLGCVGCPLQGRDGMLRDFERWPRYKELYIRAFDQMIKNHPGEIRPVDRTAKQAGSEQAEIAPNKQQSECSSGLSTTAGERIGYDFVVDVDVSHTGHDRTKPYNPDPKVADFLSAEEVFRAYTFKISYKDCRSAE